jgi:hypothetical protein
MPAGAARSSPLSLIALHHFHGSPTRVRTDATAFGIRQEHYLVEVLASWEPAAKGPAHRAWAQSLFEALAPGALPGGYPNLLGPDDRKQIAAAYGDNLKRLQRAKRLFDPNHVLSATPLPFGNAETPLAV